MSTQLFPALAGLGWSVKRRPLWSTRKQEAISGKRTHLADWSFPRWSWELSFEFLRQAGANQQTASFAGASYGEFAVLAGFFNARQGMFDSFLFQDSDDNTAPADQAIGIGDNTTTTFQLARTFGGFVEPIFAPNLVTNVKVNGTVKTPGIDYTVANWGVAAPGVVTFATPPAAAATIVANFSFYFPVTFAEDGMDFEKFMGALYRAKGIKLESVK
jgi:uncharacterized protein (TIGR02217 family)